MKITDLAGKYTAELDGKCYSVTLPGTLDENGVGEKEQFAEKWHPDAAINEAEKADVITTRFTRRHAWEGVAHFTKTFNYEKEPGKRVFVKVERARALKLDLNGSSVTEYEKGTLSTPYVFEVTDYLKNENTLTFISSNLYEGMPDTAIKYSSAATNETQTNWNGLLGKIELCEENANFINSVRVLPEKNSVDVTVELDAAESSDCKITLQSAVIEGECEKEVSLKKGINEIFFSNVTIKSDALLWDEYEGNLHTLTVLCDKCEEKTVKFGMRVFEGNEDGHLSLNGHRIFLRSEANCCVFANTGYMPMTVSEWKECLALYKAYGVNCVRFHSHCPPEAAFSAADEMGIMIQPELSNWDPKTAFETQEAFDYYYNELAGIIKAYANHPSFCMLTLGNELHCNDEGVERMHELLHTAKRLDKTRLYAVGSNEFYGRRGADAHSDFYTSSNFFNDMIRGTSAGMHGHINNSYPNTKKDYSHSVEKLRESFKKPVFSFEVGQYEVLPDFKEIDEFTGVLIPDNLIYVKDKVKKAGFLDKWEKWVEASGELSRIAYREEIEAVLRTPQLSGISLLGLQDFPGQGTALVGMINSHFKSKPYDFAKPEKFRAFFASQLPLVKLDKYTYTTDENLTFNVLFANYGKENITASWQCELEGVSVHKGDVVACPHSTLTEVGTCSFSLKNVEKSKKCTLKVTVGGFVNEYPIWVYKDEEIEEGSVVTACSLNDALKHLECGKTVFLSPKAEKESFEKSIKTQFSTDFWSVGTFPHQDGYMGCVPKPEHPLFEKFPTDEHSDWQWWSLTKSRAMILEGDTEPLFDVMDCYARLRKLAFMVEARVGDGKLLISSMGLLEKQEYPEVRAMLRSIYSYMNSNSFNPTQELTKEDLEKILT